ncbi:MAG: hypothetical protein ICV84_16155 [Flavisolibacter sp.]|nr:hypothetical protein [Flavisolibacter sp.]MBD0296706.1 hypothetical protein [Flavisolibacter sp.]
MKTSQQGSRLENRDTLLNRWIENFYSTLRPKLAQGRFRFVTPDHKKLEKYQP